MMVAMTIDDGCYGNMSQLLWGLVMVAMETRCGCALTPCGCVNMSYAGVDEMSKDDLPADRSAVSSAEDDFHTQSLVCCAALSA